ncbi:hypothetical protein IF1G_09420 [Cordyceps javanica]|uniref:Uncharacterized protein n=1 Tax=Cordyceps javanica TaxID=43265 RepID=A0A545UQU7_9HYPO|nr:hypothetical protein IF1G_09420 [Cordyceps javanica]TQW03783.1 hypothetical protein IF2G_08612 [Cordyceps javanica]
MSTYSTVRLWQGTTSHAWSRSRGTCPFLALHQCSRARPLLLAVANRRRVERS